MNEIILWSERSDAYRAWFAVTPERVTYRQERYYDFGPADSGWRSPQELNSDDYDAMHHERVWGAMLPAAIAAASAGDMQAAVQMMRRQAELASEQARQYAATAEWMYAACGVPA